MGIENNEIFNKENLLAAIANKFEDYYNKVTISKKKKKIFHII